MKKNKKMIFQIVFLIALFTVTFYYIFRNNELDQIIADLKYTNKFWICIGFIGVFLFIFCEAHLIHKMLKGVNYKIPLLRCIKYSIIGFFYSAITPSASGGQPMQMYYMKKDGIGYSVSTVIMMIITIAYKFVLVFCAALLVLFPSDFIFSQAHNVRFVIYYGVIANVICIAFLIVVICNEKIIYSIVEKLFDIGAKFHLVKNREKWITKIHNSCEKFKGASTYIRGNILQLIYVFIVTFFQRISLFFVTYCVYRSFGLKGISVIDILALQMLISLAVDMLPLPGGIGASESGFAILFSKIFTHKFVVSGMLLSRGISFYMPLIITGIYTIILHIKLSFFSDNRKMKKSKKKQVKL